MLYTFYINNFLVFWSTNIFKAWASVEQWVFSSRTCKCFKLTAYLWLLIRKSETAMFSHYCLQVKYKRENECSEWLMKPCVVVLFKGIPVSTLSLHKRFIFGCWAMFSTIILYTWVKIVSTWCEVRTILPCITR